MTRNPISTDAHTSTSRFQNHHACIASYLEQLEATPADVETQYEADSALWTSVSSSVKTLKQ